MLSYIQSGLSFFITYNRGNDQDDCDFSTIFALIIFVIVLSINFLYKSARYGLSFIGKWSPVFNFI